MSSASLQTAVTFLFVPATRPERLAKALASGADVAVIDLEDAVAPDAKGAARQLAADALEGIEQRSRGRIILRVNGSDTPWHREDLLAAMRCIGTGLGGVMLPKAERPADVATAAHALGSAAHLMPLIESLAGVDGLGEIARCPRVVRLGFGHLDYQADLGMECDAEEADLLGVRHEIVAASRRADLAPPADGVTTAFDDPVKVRTDALRARRAGFGAKLCIHPAQVEPVRSAFAPSPDELAWAQRVLDADAQARGGVCVLDGRMVDGPVVRQARRIAGRAQ